MEAVRYPAIPTIKVFGGLSKMQRALGLSAASTVQRWQDSKTGFIPSWRSHQIEAAAAQHGIQLPRPRKAKPAPPKPSKRRRGQT